MDNDLSKILSGVSLFSGADKTLLERVLTATPNIKEYKAGQTISPRSNGNECNERESRNKTNEKQLVVILGGKARVFSSLGGCNVVLRDLSRCDVFGVAELFSAEDSEISHVIAKTDCKVLLIPESSVKKLLCEDENAMYAYISFLEKRIRFLNRRISCFTAGSVERKLALWLDFAAEDDGNSTVCKTPLGTLADMLNIGRASLYRAMESLESDGFVRRDGKKFILTNRPGMVEKYNL